MAKKSEPTGWRYVGNGTYIPGVPARDLTPVEMQEYTEVISVQSSLLGVALYEATYVEQPEAPVVAREQR